MTIREAIQNSDDIKPNQFSTDQKIKWLAMVDGLIVEEIMKLYDDSEVPHYEADDIDKELIVPYPYDTLYVDYLKMKIDEGNEEYGKYNNSAVMFNNSLDNFSKHMARTTMPKAYPNISY